VINDGTRILVGDALRASFQKYANIIFDDKGACSSQPPFWVGIRIDPDVTHAQGGLATSYGGYTWSTTQTPSMWLPLTIGQAISYCDWTFVVVAGNGDLFKGERECMKYVVVHEFAHALGFQHESHRPDRPADAPCPRGGAQQSQQGDPPNTLLTNFDPNSSLDWNYCTPINGQPYLTANDIAGTQAIYGGGTQQGLCPPGGCLKVKYSLFSELRPYAIRGQLHRRWLMAQDGGAVSSQSFIGEWERVRFERVGGQPADGLMRYGDVIYIRDIWGHYLNSNPSRVVATAPWQREWERWVVTTIDNTKFPNGSPVHVNAPLRLVSQAHGYRLSMGDPGVGTTTANQTSELRINGPLKALDTGM
jgi:hypothetical protein